MEVIHIPGYTHEEKLHIAVKYLVPKQVREHGLTREQVQIPEDSVKLISKCEQQNISFSLLGII
jgi:ATP-dependent Lon protease